MIINTALHDIIVTLRSNFSKCNSICF